MSALYRPEDSGILLVYSEPGQNVTLEEFHDWYDNEHVPLRLPHIPAFRSGARYAVTSSDSSASRPFAKASWGAIYTINSNAIYNDPAYTGLRANRSPREADLVKRLAVLDRRIYKLVSDTGPADVSTAPTRKEDIAPVLVATSVTPAKGNEEAYDEWYDQEHTPMLTKVPGWRRTRRFELVDALVNGQTAASENGDAKDVPRCLGLHEYDNDSFASTPEYKAALSTPWRQRVIEAGIDQRERRVMKLYRAWDPEAALKEVERRDEDAGR